VRANLSLYIVYQAQGDTALDVDGRCNEYVVDVEGGITDFDYQVQTTYSFSETTLHCASCGTIPRLGHSNGVTAQLIDWQQPEDRM